MKKLKLKALELGASEVLTRAQMKNVWGGGADCIVTNVRPGPNGSTYIETTSITWPSGSGMTCSGMSSYAGSYANSQQVACGGSTHYDCGCDGWGS